MNKTELKMMIPTMSDKELLEMYRLSESELLTRSHDDKVSWSFTELRERFYQRFSPNQVEMFQPWVALNEAKQKQFKKVWLLAIKKFVDRGYADNSNLRDLIIFLVAHSHLLIQLTFPGIVDSLEQIDELFNNHFPGYINAGGDELMKEKIKYGS